MKLLAGRLSKSGHRRRWIAVGYGIAVIGKIVVAAAFVWPLVLLGRTVDRLGKGIRGVPRDALIADETPDSERGRAFGFHRSLDTLGAVVGPLLGLLLLSLFNGRIRPALGVAIIPAVISVALVGLVRERTSQARPATRLHTDDASPGSPDRSLPAGFWRTLAPLAVFAIVNSTDALLLQRAAELGLSINAVVFVYVLYNIVYAALGYPAGKLSDSVAPRIVFAVGLVIFAVVYLGLGITTSSATVWLLLPLYGAYTALTDGVSRAWITRLVPPDQHTWALGIHGAMIGIGALTAGIWAGLAWHGTGRLPLTITGIVAAMVAGWLFAHPSLGTPRSAT